MFLTVCAKTINITWALERIKVSYITHTHTHTHRGRKHNEIHKILLEKWESRGELREYNRGSGLVQSPLLSICGIIKMKPS
jgi:hypothetical protein